MCWYLTPFLLHLYLRLLFFEFGLIVICFNNEILLLIDFVLISVIINIHSVPTKFSSLVLV